ncbi:MAG: hypothetical protein GEU71_04780 [Actinobacteria bacterium]|nr:hypothetical protein [Actinomycetota bacterium]
MQTFRSRPRRPWLVIAAALALAVYLWTRAVETSSRSFLIIGNGQALDPGEVTTTRIDPVLVALGFVALVLGLGVAWLMSRRDGPSVWPLAALALAVVGAVATTAAVVRAPEIPGAALESTESVIEAMGAAGLDCTRADPPDRPPGFASEEARCLVPWSAAVVRGGLAVVVIDLWKSAEARDDWMASPRDVGGAALAGSSWLVRCEFRSICAQFQTEAGGRFVLSPPGERYDLTSWRYYEKPFPISVEHAITGHYPPEEDAEAP